MLTINGFSIFKSPDDLSLISSPVPVSIPAGTTRTISIPTEFNGVAKSVQLVNQDGANVALARVNGVTTPQFNVPAGGAIGFDNQWITEIQITAGAAGACIAFLQMVKMKEISHGV